MVDGGGGIVVTPGANALLDVDLAARVLAGSPGPGGNAPVVVILVAGVPGRGRPRPRSHPPTWSSRGFVAEEGSATVYSHENA